MKNAMQLKAIMKKLAKENQISAQLVLQNYMLERFLERVSLSPYRDNYIIKGGFLISSMVGLNSRATMDMDATIKGYPVTQDAVQKMIEQILTVPVDDDITFTFKSIGEIREGDEYTGYRVALTADFPPMPPSLPPERTKSIWHLVMSSALISSISFLYSVSRQQSVRWDSLWKI